MVYAYLACDLSIFLIFFLKILNWPDKSNH